MPRDPNGGQLQTLVGNGTRVNLTAAVASSNAAVPSGCVGYMAIIRCTDYVWLNFGTSSGVTAAATSASQLVPPGEGAIYVPTGTTHVAVLRSGSADAAVQLETSQV